MELNTVQIGEIQSIEERKYENENRLVYRLRCLDRSGTELDIHISEFQAKKLFSMFNKIWTGSHR